MTCHSLTLIINLMEKPRLFSSIKNDNTAKKILNKFQFLSPVFNRSYWPTNNKNLNKTKFFATYTHRYTTEAV